jgi:hypothetical protein
MTKSYFPMVIEPEASGVISGWIVGLRLFAQGATRADVQRRLQAMLRQFVIEYPDRGDTPAASIRVAVLNRFRTKAPRVTLRGPAALVRTKSPARIAAARANGLLGGRPPLHAVGSVRHESHVTMKRR